MRLPRNRSQGGILTAAYCTLDGPKGANTSRKKYKRKSCLCLRFVGSRDRLTLRFHYHFPTSLSGSCGQLHLLWFSKDCYKIFIRRVNRTREQSQSRNPGMVVRNYTEDLTSLGHASGVTPAYLSAFGCLRSIDRSPEIETLSVRQGQRIEQPSHRLRAV